MAPEGAGLAGGEFTERSILASGLEWVSRLLLPAHIVERIRTIVATTEPVGGWWT